MYKTKRSRVFLVSGVALFFIGITGAVVHAEALRAGKVEVKPMNGSEVRGILTVTPIANGGGILIEGNLTGLKPNSLHGFHIHENGKCASDSAPGGHFNPTREPHGNIDQVKSHVGDLGNIVADEHGAVELSIRKKEATLFKGDKGIMGRSMIVHASADDLHSQPSGKSGPFIACGIIDWVLQPEKH